MRRAAAARIRFGLCLAWVALLPPPVAGGEFVLEIKDGARRGFNDDTSVAAVTGNPGTTLGEQRVNAFEAAGRDWLNRLVSGPDIRVEGAWESLDCDESSGVLAFAGPTFIFADPRLPKPNTWYTWAQTNAVFGSEVNADEEDGHITLRLNSDVGTPGCLSALSWDYRIGTPVFGANVSAVNVIRHELAHGLGFISFVDEDDGSKFMGNNDAYSNYLEDHSRGQAWPRLSNGQRLASMMDAGDTHWIGPNSLLDAAVLVAGRDGSHPLVYIPTGDEEGGAISHFDPDVNAQVDDQMEPFIVPRMDTFLTVRVLQDIGWSVNHPSVVGLENIDGAGVDDVAVLRIGRDPARHNVRVFEPSTGQLIREFGLPDDVTALDLAAIPSYAGTSASELVALTWAARGNRIQVFVHDASSGRRLKTLNFPASYPKAMVPVASFGGTSADEIAILTVLPSGAVKVFVKDVQSGAVLTNQTFPEGMLGGFAVVPSFGGGPAPELAVVIVDPGAGVATLYVRDAASGVRLLEVLLPSDFLPSRATSVRHFGGTGADEVALLGTRRANGNPQLRVVDASSGAILTTRTFPDKFHPRGFASVPDFGNTPADELAIVGRRRLNLRTRVFVVDAASGATLTSTALPTSEEPHDLDVVPDFAGSNADELLIVTTGTDDGEIRAWAKDARGMTLGRQVVGEGN
ncbi:MAG: hypothetical protein R3190_06760 [Thermoanaerobaculia bacterium]|nr:hypothetical protein [Thermoanaerobaculia bacterium]